MLKRYISSKLRQFVEHTLKQEARNIKRELCRRALSSTADYVEKNMRDITSVNTKYKVHDESIKNITIKDGVVLEFGVYMGDTINYVSKKLPQYDIFGFDSFEGLPEFWRDGFDKNAFSVNQLPPVEKNVNLIKGWFNETLPIFLENENRKIAYLHIDCDLYSSTKTILDNLAHLIVPGTVIVFDEYFNFPGWENDEFKAFQEYVVSSGRRYKYLTYNWINEQASCVITD